jgi:hypothetical protein
MWHPPCVALGTDEFQLWMPLEDATQDHESHDILHCPNDAKKIVHGVPAMGHIQAAFPGRQNVKTDGQP